MISVRMMHTVEQGPLQQTWYIAPTFTIVGTISVRENHGTLKHGIDDFHNRNQQLTLWSRALNVMNSIICRFKFKSTKYFAN